MGEAREAQAKVGAPGPHRQVCGRWRAHGRRVTFGALVLKFPLRPLLVLAATSALQAPAQVNAPVNGPRARAPRVVAFTHATIHAAPDKVLRDATLVIEDDRIVAVGGRVQVPRNAQVRDLKGAHLWPGLIEPYSGIGALVPERNAPPPHAGYWNRAVHADHDAAAAFVPDAAAVKELRAQGFTTAIVHRMDGIVRGTGAAVALTGGNTTEDILLSRSATHFSFRKGSSPDEYPGSLMGSIALLRQLLLDARWYADGADGKQRDVQMEALNAQLDLPLVFEAEGREDVLRIARIGREFGLSFIVKGAGDEYMRLADVLDTRQPLIIPLLLPEAFDVRDPYDALEVGLGDLKHWELAGSNAGRIAAADGTFAFTTRGLKETAAMWPALRRMVQQGLDTADAIAALTTVPARLFRMEDRVGRLEVGLRADLVISSAHLLHPDNVVHETWTGGVRHLLKPLDQPDPRAAYALNIDGRSLRLVVKGSAARPEAEVRGAEPDTTMAKAELVVNGPLVTLAFNGVRLGLNGRVRLSGIMHERGGLWDGQGQLSDERWVGWSALRQRDSAAQPGTADNEARDSTWNAPMGEVWYPMNAFGRTLFPDTQTVILRNATVWTNGPQGILREADVCIHGGRILAVGRGLRKADLFKGRTEVIELDMRGRHITSGIIDEHSHIGIARGVNEATQAVVSEVRIGDVIDPDAVDLYRNLAGGVTVVQQLHGSADPIGGQSSLIKLRYGRNADGLRLDDAPGHIKFALGENVKQSNWSSRGRYPQSRMGVEQVFRDAFIRAKDYAAAWRTYDGLKAKGKAAARAPRRDLELEAIAEILEGRRHITCHSYVRSEILMLMRVADSLGFKVNTFTHVLEGYKVAGPLKAHGANASTFSDWWAYKYEVNDAIPYNAALLMGEGVNTCINSDDAEMARRLNQEAAKTIKYGGLTPEEAWKTVTLAPARALHIDHRVGSLEPGKDADVVVWTADPLTIDARVERSWIDGVCYYDATQAADQQQRAQAERARLIARMQQAGKEGATRKPRIRRPRHIHCDSVEEEMP